MNEKNNFLENMWNVHVSQRPYDNINDKEYNEILDKQNDVVMYLQKHLPGIEWMNKFMEFKRYEQELHNHYEFEAFKYGFYAGLEIGMEGKDFHF